MTGRRLTAVDAQTLWMSAAVPNDQFLLYGFAGTPADIDGTLRAVRERAAGCPELCLRVHDGNALAYPQWVAGVIEDEQVVVHDLVEPTWSGCLSAVSALADAQLDARRMTWRLHVFTPVVGVPGVAGPGTVAVMQITHALGDGQLSAALAGYLFGRDEQVPVVAGAPVWLPAALPVRGWRAARSHQRLVRDAVAGDVPSQADSRPVLSTNNRPAGAREVRTLIRRHGEIPGPSVTVGVLAAVSEALAGQLRAAGEDPTTLGAEVPMAKTGVRLSRNHFANVAVGLYPDLDRGDRIDRMVSELTDRRRRARHPAMQSSSDAFAAVPAPLLRWGIGRFDPGVRPSMVTGNTVVSSVNRGAADLRFGDAPVVVTAGYPALSPMMGLVHGVHGIGDTIAVSVHAAESAVGDIDAYAERLDAALA